MGGDPIYDTEDAPSWLQDFQQETATQRFVFTVNPTALDELAEYTVTLHMRNKHAAVMVSPNYTFQLFRIHIDSRVSL